MTRTTISLLATTALLGCAATDTRDPAERVTLLPASDGGAAAEYSRDGRLAFERVVEGRSAIFVANADASNAKRVSFGVWDWGPRWSPDGKWIAFQRDGGLQNDIVFVPADSGAEVVVAASSANEQLQNWLPDGSGLLFVRATERGGEPWLYRVAERSSEKPFVAEGTASLSLSPDGRWIAYALQKGGNSTVWLLDRASKTQRQLTTEGFETVTVDAFSPDSRRIVYESRRSGTADLWTVDVATGERRQLTQDVADDFGAQWSPDGARIAFSSNRGGQPDVWVIGRGEADVQRVTDDVVGEIPMRWTPDGRGVVALVLPGHAHLYSVSMADSAAVPLTSGDWDVNAAVLSRDGTRIAYVGTKNGDADIWTVAAAGGESRLVAGGPGSDNGPDFSPDGKSIAFTSVRAGNPDIWIASADSGATSPRQFTDWPSIENSAEWSPDGQMIAFLSTRESSGTDLWTMPAAGGAPKRLTRLGTVNLQYDWSKDGRTIAFSAQSSSGDRMIFSVPAAGGAPTQLVSATSGAPEWSPDGRRLAVTKCTLAGYCDIEVRDQKGALVNSLSPKSNNYEFQMRWSSDGSQVLIASQDLTTNAANRVFLRPAAGGAGRQLARSLGQALPIGFTAGDRAAIVLGAPYGFETQRIAVSAARPAP